MKKRQTNEPNGKVEISLMNIRRGHIWLANLNPTLGDEIGEVSPSIMQLIVTAIAIVIEYEPVIS